MARGKTRIVMAAAGTALFAMAAGAVTVAVVRLETIAPALADELGRTERRVAKLSRELDLVRERDELQAWMQEQMRRANPRLTASDATHYSELLLGVTDRYEGVEPLFLLAVGMVESHFEAAATSHANARGLYQIWPPTGRWLAEELGWEYYDAMLHVPEKNTELAACYLEKLFATYGDPALVLAEYNGGPKNARRLRLGRADVAAETKEYVIKVMVTFERLAASAPVAIAENATNELDTLSDD